MKKPIIAIQRLYILYPELAKNLRLTPEQRQVMNLVIKLRKITSHELQNVRKISIHQASNVLNKLWRKKYLDRSYRQDPTGGIFYVYSIHNKLNL